MPPQKRVPKAKGLPFHPAVTVVLVLILLALFLLGQYQVFHGKNLLGFILSALSVGAGLALYFGAELLQMFPTSPKGKRGPAASKPSPRAGKGRAGSGKSWNPLDLMRALGVLAAFVLAGMGQFYFSQAGSDPAGRTGAWLFLAAAVLFVASFWPWQREGLKNTPLPFTHEMILLGLILAVAAFLRSYQIDTNPSGLFIDQGFQGYSALRILHEGWRPFYIEDIFHAYSLALYQLALWFQLFGAGEVSLKLFYAFLGLLGFPLVYWTFRQLAGPRLALLGLFILAVMRWNYLFSRNGFPTVQMTLYMFGTLAFLLYAIQAQKPKDKRLFYGGAIAAGAFFVLGIFPFVFLSLFWTLKEKSAVLAVLAVLSALGLLALAGYFIKASKNRDTLVATLLAAGFFIAGAYTYQAYKVFPLLVLVWGAYEAAVNWKELKKKWPYWVLFSILSVVLVLPVLSNPNTRENNLMVHGFKQFLEVAGRTAIMFNREGDPNPRHNLQDYRMLDNVSGALLVLGLSYALFRVYRRKYFYILAGFFIMSLPCILSIDAAHANRLFALTPFLAFLLAVPLAAVWGRARALWGEGGEWGFFIAALPFLVAMTNENFDVYFHKQAHNQASWSEYSIAETSAGRMVANHGGNYDYFVTPRYYNFYTLDFLAYPWLNQVKPLLLPDNLLSRSPNTTRGLYYALENGRTGVLDMLKALYPGGKDEYLVDPTGNTVEYFFRVPPEEAAKVRGLTAHFDRDVQGNRETQVGKFPDGLPPGPYHAQLEGNLFVAQSGDYRWEIEGNVKAAIRISGQRGTEKDFFHVDRGENPIEIEVTVPDGVTPAMTIHQIPQKGVAVVLDAGSFDRLPAPRGLLGSYFNGFDSSGEPLLTEWDPVINYTNGNDFSVQPPPASIHWKGNLEIQEGGLYRFFCTPSGLGQLKVDGKEWSILGPRGEGKSLQKGKHSISLDVGKGERFDNFSFFWVKPDGKTEVVPYSAFGEIR